MMERCPCLQWNVKAFGQIDHRFPKLDEALHSDEFVAVELSDFPDAPYDKPNTQKPAVATGFGDDGATTYLACTLYVAGFGDCPSPYMEAECQLRSEFMIYFGEGH